jgi:hypothetical protein
MFHVHSNALYRGVDYVSIPFHPFPSILVLNVPGLLKLDIFTVFSLANGKQKSERMVKEPSGRALIST